MSNIWWKRRAKAGGTGTEPTPCTDPDSYRCQNLITSHSEETTGHRCDENVAGHRKGVSRRSSAPQIVFGRYKCAYQTLRCTCLSGSVPTPLTHPFQQSKDVEDKLKDLIPWLVKLKDSVATANANGNHEEAERRKQLTRCT